jgi:single-strand DNA-binding protein
MLKATLIGHCGNDATVSNVNGKTVINLNVAHSESWVDNQGVKNQRSIWVGLSYWTEKTGIAQYLKKGVQIYAEGGIEPRLYKPQAGEPQAQLAMRVTNIQLLGSPQNQQSQPQGERAPVGNSDISNDNLSF